MRHDGVPAQFIRFACVGTLAWAAQIPTFLSFSAALGAATANLLAASLSTVLANDLHRRVTFTAGDRVTWLRAQLEGGLLSLTALLATTAALFVVDWWRPGASRWEQLIAITAISAAVGLVRFAGLRRFVFG